MKNSRLFIVLLVVFAALAALLAIQGAQPRAIVNGVTAVPTELPVFDDFSIDTLQAVRLRSPEIGQSLVLSRGDDGTWTAPDLAGTLNQTEAGNIARTMVILPYSRTVTLADGENMADYGFDPGVLSIELVLTDGGIHGVLVGYRTPTEQTYYALIDDRPQLYLIERGAIDFLISRVKSPPVA